MGANSPQLFPELSSCSHFDLNNNRGRHLCGVPLINTSSISKTKYYVRLFIFILAWGEKKNVSPIFSIIFPFSFLFWFYVVSKFDEINLLSSLIPVTCVLED
jgi:hypothetical protein